MKQKFTLEFDKKPALVFVQHSEKPNDFDVYQDGEKVEGIRNIDIDAGFDTFTTHRIEYLTGNTEKEKIK